MSFFTCFWVLPQKEHFSRSLVSPILVMSQFYVLVPIRAWVFALTSVRRENNLQEELAFSYL
jgi:hypothetical protein